VRWYTVITVSRINPNEELEIKLMRFTKKFQQLLSDKAKPSPGKRFMNFQLNSGNEAILKGCMKYMGDGHTAIKDTVNTELIELGRQPHKYHYGEMLDKMLPDYYIKKLLEDYLNATSWDSVSDNVKKACYKGFPTRQLPNWDNIRL